MRFLLRDVTDDVREQIYKIGVNEERVTHNNRAPKKARLVDQATPSGKADSKRAGELPESQTLIAKPVETVSINSIAESNEESKGKKKVQFQMWDDGIQEHEAVAAVYDALDFLTDAVNEHRVISYDKEMSDGLPVIAQHLKLGNITAPSLKANVSQFQKEVKNFRAKNRIQYQRWDDTEDDTQEESRGREQFSYSDYSKAAKKMNINKVDFNGYMADAFLYD